MVRAARLLFALVASGWTSPCDVGDAVSALNAGSGSFEPAVLASIDLATQPQPEVTVDWNSGSISHRVIQVHNLRRNGTTCVLLVDVGQAFSAHANVSMMLKITGSHLTIACRLLPVDPAHDCGSATIHAGASAPPGQPEGATSMHFFDVIFETAGSYKLCFWSGQSVGGLGAGDIASYKTTLGTLVATDLPAPSVTAPVSLATQLSRRRGLTYGATSLRVQGSSGASIENVTANPAGWNVHLPKNRHGTCRSCTPYSLEDVDSNLQERTSNLLSGPLLGSVSGGQLESACEATGRSAPQGLAAVLLARRGGCTFELKAQVAAARGYVGLVMVDHSTLGRPLPDMIASGGSEAAEMPVPAWVIPNDEASLILALLASDAVVTLTAEDVARKARLATGQSDGHGTRLYQEL